jgi:Glycosyltransferase family 87
MSLSGVVEANEASGMPDAAHLPGGQLAGLRRMLGLLCVLAGSTIFVVWGLAFERNSAVGMCDFMVVYDHARVLVSHWDPYKEDASHYAQLNSEGYLNPRSVNAYGMPMMPCVYPPTTLLVISPIAILHWASARLVWITLISSSMVVAALLMWELGADNAPLLSGILIGLLVANSGTLLFEGNAAGVAVSLCLIAAWCFLRGRFGWFGVVCLSLSLLIKPHDGGLVWLFFLLAGGEYRKRASQTFLLTAVLGIVAAIWAFQVSPHWMQELKENISSAAQPGGTSDPGPTSATHLAVNSAINLQTAVSVFKNDPQWYDPASYAICGVLLGLWLVAVVRSKATHSSSLLALASIAALSMLFGYHRHHDAKLLLLLAPVCSLMWVKSSGTIRYLAVLISVAAMASVADVPRAMLTVIVAQLQISTVTTTGKILTVMFGRPAPLALLSAAVFFLYALVRDGQSQIARAGDGQMATAREMT